MGLRFRKSVKLCKGVRLNFGKNGVSISTGIPGFRKTVHSSGRVTTSVGIPETGIYYVDTKNPSKEQEEKKSRGFFSDLFGGNQNSSSTVSNNTTSYSNNSTSQERTTAKSATTVYPVCEDTTVQPTNASSKGVTLKKSEPIENVIGVSEYHHPAPISVVDEPIVVPTVEPVSVAIPVEEKKPEGITYETIKAIFENCDVAIDWVDVISHKAPTSDDVVSETWEYLHKKAVDVFDGNIDTYLEIIRAVNPYDDLLDYADNFEFSTDTPDAIEVEFSIINTNTDTLTKSAFEDYCSAIAIRVARDTFALLPIEYVIVTALLDGKQISTARINRSSFVASNFEQKNPSELLHELKTTII